MISVYYYNNKNVSSATANFCNYMLLYDKFRPLKHCDRGFESHSKHGYLSAFILFVLAYVGSGFATS
jgi:hypothetical protein